MSILPSERVYQGCWVDYSKGDVMGATITTTSNTANIVVAILSVMITLAGSYTWDVVAFCYFSLCSSRHDSDGLHHQRQAVLRNIASPPSVLFKAVNMYRGWRGRAVQPLARLLPLVSVALLYVVSVSWCLESSLLRLSRTLVSQSLRNLIVVASRIETIQDSLDINLLSGAYVDKALDVSLRFARNCYNGSESDPSCEVYVTRAIPFQTMYSSCPFGDLCTLKSNQALVLDTGPLFSDKVFGINVRRQDSMAVRLVTTCTPLNVTRYVAPASYSEGKMIPEFNRPPFPGAM